ncbi:HAD-like domain-containing protein [Pyronema omphalodes]|nr:HAD-like domain-containing protein [Pyronema omphalodes]
MIPNNRPSPTEVYLKTVDIPTTRRETPAQLLIILDLNGTLLCRASKGAVGSSTPTRRPGLAYFLEYLFKNHKVMVWTSARPENATRMVNACFTQVQKESLLALWARDTLGLTKLEYNAKTQVYKTLERVWEGEFQIKVQENQFTQFNTVLFDDSIEKARAHPYNLVCVPEFTASSAQKSSDEVLWQCIEYLEELKWQTNVTNYIRHTPFEYQPKKPKFLLPGDVDTKKKKKKNKKEKQEKQEAAANASGSEESQETGAWMETGEASRHQNSASSEGSPMMG